jgi:hypothetical protein
MACIDAPVPPFPTLPTGITLGAGIPTPSFDIRFCCKLLEFSPAPIPPIVVTGAVLDTLAALLASLNGYFDLIPFTCPREAGP